MIVEYDPSYADEIAESFFKSIHAIDDSIYTQMQKKAWAPTPIDYPFWRSRLALKKPYIYKENDKVLGFIELESNGQIDCFYVLPDAQGIGVGSSLYRHVESIARKREYSKLFVEASIVAKPIFIKKGFRVIKENVVNRGSSSLVNYSMEKVLISS